MLHILGMFGKGIGITLLLIIALLLAALFVPIRYRVRAWKDEGELAAGKGNLFWLFHIVNVFAIWEDELHYGLRIFGILVYDNLRAAKKGNEAAKKNKKRKPRRERQSRKREPDEDMWEEIPTSDTKASASEIKDKTPQVQSGNPYQGKEEKKAAEQEIKPAEKIIPEKKATAEKTIVEKITLWQKARQFIGAIKGFFSRVTDAFRRMREKMLLFLEKLKHIKERIEFWHAFVLGEVFQSALMQCKKQARYIWRDIHPRKVKGGFNFGFEDPCTTGQAVAALSLLYPVFGKGLVLCPDFENTACSGSFFMKGNITVFVLLRAGWILYFDKNIRQVLATWKKEEALHG